MISRRASLIGLGVAGMAGWSRPSFSKGTGPLSADSFKTTGIYMNGAYMHPMPVAAADAMAKFIASRVDPTIESPDADARPLFARLINAHPNEIAYVPSTMAGENFVADALGLKAPSGQRVITDVLHFEGSLYMYQELAKRGLDLTILPMADNGTIDMNRLEAALEKGAKLVAISLVSWVNGFQHDLKAVCDLAHRKGAYVYVDAIQGVGAVPVDVRASGVDFLAASSFKWLMGDFGCGFLYVREDLLKQLPRMEFGYRQFDDMKLNYLPGSSKGRALFEAVPIDGTATGRFEMGTIGAAARVATTVSLKGILDRGVLAIQGERQALMDRLRQRLAGHYQSLTPSGSRSPIISFACPGAESKFADALKQAGITISLYDDRFRVSPSVYNSVSEIERLADILVV